MSFFQDARYGIRILCKTPSFAIVIVLLLALGIGATTAVFSVANGVLLRSMPVPNAKQLLVLGWRSKNLPNTKEYHSFGDCGGRVGGANPSGCSFPLDFLERLRSQAGTFSGVAGFAGPANLWLAYNGTATEISGQFVSGDFFSMLGVRAALGRTLVLEDDTPSSSPSVVISHSLWRSTFGGDQFVCGRAITLNDISFTIVGVIESGFAGLSPGKTQDLWIPIMMLPRLGISWGRHIADPHDWWLVILGRLKQSISVERAEATASLEFRDGAQHTFALFREDDRPRIVAVPVHDGLNGQRGVYSAELWVLGFAVGIVLLVTCANVGGMLLSMGAARKKEIATRVAVGADISRIIRQLLTENIILSTVGGVLGLLVSIWGMHIVTAFMSGSSHKPFPFAIALDWRAALFALFVSFLSGLVFGLAPAYQSAHISPMSVFALGKTHRREAEETFGTASVLVVAQVALCFVVLVGSGLIIRTLVNLYHVKTGFDVHNLLLFEVDSPLTGDKATWVDGLNARNVDLAYRNLRERFAAIPGVVAATYASDELLSGGLWTSTVHVEGEPMESERDVDLFAIGPDFLETTRIPLLAGRFFDSSDFEEFLQSGEDTQGESERPLARLLPVLINATLAKSYFLNQNPVGKRIIRGNGTESASGGMSVKYPPSREWEVVGLLGDTKTNSLRREIQPTIYLPLRSGSGYFSLRSTIAPSSLIANVRIVLSQVDNSLVLSNIRTEEEQIDQSLWQERFLARAGAILSFVTLILTCLGLYGLLSYDVTQRKREIGIRMALGAPHFLIQQLVLKQGLLLALSGITTGIIAATALTRYLSSLLYGVRPLAASLFLVVAAVLLFNACAACYMPVRRALRVDPNAVLRDE